MVEKETPIGTLVNYIEQSQLEIYKDDNKTFDSIRGASLVDIAANLLSRNSRLFIEFFEKLKTSDIRESFERTRNEIVRLFDSENVTLKQLGEIKSAASGISDLGTEVRKV